MIRHIPRKVLEGDNNRRGNYFLEDIRSELKDVTRKVDDADYENNLSGLLLAHCDTVLTSSLVEKRGKENANGKRGTFFEITVYDWLVRLGIDPSEIWFQPTDLKKELKRKIDVDIAVPLGDLLYCIMAKTSCRSDRPDQAALSASKILEALPFEFRGRVFNKCESVLVLYREYEYSEYYDMKRCCDRIQRAFEPDRQADQADPADPHQPGCRLLVVSVCVPEYMDALADCIRELMPCNRFSPTLAPSIG